MGRVKKPYTAVTIGSLRLSNPVMVASGTFEYRPELAALMRPQRFGAIVAKTITLTPQEGNRPPRTCETPSGMLNAIGLQSAGIDDFIDKKLPVLAGYEVPLIASIAGRTVEEFTELASRLDQERAIGGIEINLSCPNVAFYAQSGRRRTGGHVLFAQDEQATYEIIAAVRKATDKTVIAKLSPNVTDVTEIAQIAEEAGADAVALVNTLIGLAVDVATRRPKLGNITGGLSGPAIRPVAVHMVWKTAQQVSIPVIGMGGIATAADALEFLICGATAVAVGTAHFTNPRAGSEVIEGVHAYLRAQGIDDIRELIGSLKTYE